MNLLSLLFRPSVASPGDPRRDLAPWDRAVSAGRWKARIAELKARPAPAGRAVLLLRACIRCLQAQAA
jgi:hypothetical protein